MGCVPGVGISTYKADDFGGDSISSQPLDSSTAMIFARNRTVSVVDDDEPVRDSMRLLLESSGFAVRDYSSAAQFLDDPEALESCCLVLDLHMPGMNGIELVETLRKRQTGIPTLLITGKGDPTLGDRAARSSILVTLHKPVREEVLLQWIERACADR